MELVRLHGPTRLQRTGLGPFPSGEELAVAFHRKSCCFIRTTAPVDVPNFDKAWSVGDGRSTGGAGSDEEDEELELDTREGAWECPKCEQRFLLSVMDKHIRGCVVSVLPILVLVL